MCTQSSAFAVRECARGRQILIATRMQLFAGSPLISPGGVVDDGGSIRSSGLNAPFGQQSSAIRSRGGGGGGGGVSASGVKSLDRVFVAARRSGVLSMDNMSLSAFPPQVCALYDEKSITADEKFWECVDLTTLSAQHNAITSVPAQIVNLMHLQVINLAHNRLADLPDELLQLATLKKIDLSHNQLRALPEHIGELQALVEINVAHNQLTRLPDSLCDLARLEVLTVNDNQIEVLPDDMGMLTHLLRFNASANRLVGLPPSMAQLVRLAELQIKQNRLQSDASSAAASSSSRAPPRTAAPRISSSGMPSFRALKDLVLLDLSENQLRRIPELPSSSKLAQVFFGFNSLTDASALLSCGGLVTVDLHNNRLEAVPRELGRRDSTIKLLDLSNNELADIPGELGLMASLNKLLVDGNPLRKFPRAKLSAGGLGIEALKKYLVTRIDASTLASIGGDEAQELLGGGGQINSSNPDVEYAIRDGSSSHSLSLAKIAPPLASFPERVFAMPALSDLLSLDLSGQRIPDTDVPAQVSMMKRLRVLVANGCAWRSFPLQLCSLLTLQDISLIGNALTDLPRNFQAFTSLTRVNLSGNAFTTFPDVLCELGASLTQIGLANNRIASLPTDFCDVFAGALRELDLSGNRLTALPDGWRTMGPQFQSLNVENNQIASVPLELGLLTGLKSLMLSGNPQRTVLYGVIAKGAPAILAALKNKIPLDSPLLHEPAPASASASAPQQGGRRGSRRDEYDDGAVDIDTDQRSRYAANLSGGRGGPTTSGGGSSSSSAGRQMGAAPPVQRGVRSDDYGPRDGPFGYDDSQRPMQRDGRDYNRNDRAYGQTQQQGRDSYDRGGYAQQPSRAATAQPSSYARDSRPQYDDRADDRYGPPRSGDRAPSAYDRDRRPATYDEPIRRSHYDEPPMQQQQQQPRRDYGSQGSMTSAPPSRIPPPAAAAAASAGPDLSQLKRSIDDITSRLDNDLSLGSLQKMQLKKERAGMQAEFNRRQARG